jgi:hypothetical protein
MLVGLEMATMVSSFFHFVDFVPPQKQKARISLILCSSWASINVNVPLVLPDDGLSILSFVSNHNV